MDYLCDGVIYLTTASGKCDNPAGNIGNYCKLTMLRQLGEYQNIVTEITDISCPLSMSNLEVQSFSPVSLIMITSEIVHSFNATCRGYIDTLELAFKHQLQEVIFNRTGTSSNIMPY